MRYHSRMRRLLAIALVAALPAAAQIRGVPPSVTSITAGRSAPGVPASVTSLGPNGFGDRCCSGGFHSGFRHHRHHRRAVPIYVPYYYYPYYSPYPATYAAPASTAEYETAEEEPPAQTIYERRARTESSSDEERYGEHYTDYREAERRRRREEEARQAEEQRHRDEDARKADSKDEGKREEKPDDQEPVTVLVFKDGHRQDLRGYAITGEVLYDLAGGRARKILLADLDLAATIKLNDELGNDFRLPSRPPRPN
ncbi:MAG: hypothetical protein ACRD3A_13045 [Terriglobales bacterium]